MKCYIQNSKFSRSFVATPFIPTVYIFSSPVIRKEDIVSFKSDGLIKSLNLSLKSGDIFCSYDG